MYMHVLQTRVQSITCSCSSPWVSLCIGTCCSIFSCPGAKPSGKHLGRAAHPLACKLCTWGKMLRKKKKPWNFQWLQVMLPEAVSEDEWSNEAQSRQPVLRLPLSPHPLAQILAAQHHLRLHQQRDQGQKPWGICSFYFLLFPSL